MSTLLLKQSLLLSHGTVYGQIDRLAAARCAGITPNVNQWDDPDYEWRAGLFGEHTMSTSESGSMTDSAPVDLVHWNVVGFAALSPMTSWRNCLKMLTHI